MTTAKEDLNKLFKTALEKKANFVYVAVEMDGFSGVELIVNETENIEAKLNYYNKAYNDNLVLNANSGISIVAFGWTYEFSDIVDVHQAFIKEGEE